MIPPTDLPDIHNVSIQSLNNHSLKEKQIGVDVLRLDKIHTIVSGNKWFKLKYYLQAAVQQGKSGIVTFGGAFSNHLLATAFICRQMNLSSIGMIRGEKPASYSITLQEVEKLGMILQFVPRTEFYDQKFIRQVAIDYPAFVLVEEGGRGREGIKGAEEILQLTSHKKYSHILCAVGTGTMITGIINSSLPTQEVIGIPVVRISSEYNSIISFIRSNCSATNYRLIYDFHFGGYAKKTDELIRLMNNIYDDYHIPTDFVYTAKLFAAYMKMIEEDYFRPGSKILLIHSGGLQGNRSLPTGTLDFST